MGNSASSVLQNSDLNAFLAHLGTNPRYLSLTSDDKQKVLRSFTDEYIELNGLEDEQADAAKRVANRHNKVTNFNQDRVRPSAEYLSSVFEGYNPNGSKEERLAQIAAAREKSKKESLNFDYLNAGDIHFTTDLILDTEERAVRGEDTGYFGDKFNRIMEAFVTPVGSFFHTTFGGSPEDVSEGARRFRTGNFAENVEFNDDENTFSISGIRVNPQEDVSFGQKLASGIGSVGSGLTVTVGSGLVGGAVSGGNPFVVASFALAGSASFNSSVRFQEGFTAEYQTSGDMDRAVSAGFSAMPAAAIDTIADRFLVGKFGLGKFNKAVKAAPNAKAKGEIINQALKYRRTKDILSGFAFEGGTEMLGDIVSAYGQIQTTGRKELMPSGLQNFETFMIGGIIGGGLSAVGTLNTNRLINGLNRDVQDYVAAIKVGKYEEAAQIVENRNLEQRAGITAPDVPTQTQTQQADAQSKENDESSEQPSQDSNREQERPEEQRADQDAEQEGVETSDTEQETGEASASPASARRTFREDPEEIGDPLETGVPLEDKVARVIELENALTEEERAAVQRAIDYEAQLEKDGVFDVEPGQGDRSIASKKGQLTKRQNAAEKALKEKGYSQKQIDGLMSFLKGSDYFGTEEVQNAEAGVRASFEPEEQTQPINESIEVESEQQSDDTPRSAPEPAPNYQAEGTRLHIGEDGSRVADGKLVQIEGDQVVTRGPMGGVISKQKLPPDASPEAKNALVDRIARAIIANGEPAARNFSPDGVYQRGNKMRRAQDAELAASRAELGAAPDTLSGATEGDSNADSNPEAESALEALGKTLTDARSHAKRALKHKARTQAEAPVVSLIRSIVPGLQALVRANPLVVEAFSKIAENFSRSRVRTPDGPEFRELSAEQALELEEISELSRQEYFKDQKAKLGDDFPEAFEDESQSISSLRQLINELIETKGDRPTPVDKWRPLVEQHLEFLPPDTAILPDDIDPTLRQLYNDGVEYLQGLNLDELTSGEMRNLFIGLDSIVTDRSPSRMFAGYFTEAARQRVKRVAEGKGLFRSTFAKVLGVRIESVGKFFQGARGFENILKSMAPAERGRAILRTFTQPFENAENKFLTDSKAFESFFEEVFNRTLRVEKKKNEMTGIRIGLVSDIAQAFELGDRNEAVRNTIAKIRKSLAKQIEPTESRPESDRGVAEQRIRRQAERTEIELNDFLDGVELDSDALFEDVIARADEWLTDNERQFLSEMRDWFAARRNDVKFITEAIIGRPFQGIINYMPQMLLEDGALGIDKDNPIDASNMSGLTGIPDNALLRTDEQGNIKERTRTDDVPQGMVYVFDASYKFVTAGKAMLYDIATLAERKITNQAFANPDNRAVLTHAMDGRAENVNALQTNFQLRTSEQLQAHKGVNTFTRVLGWGYRRLSGRVLSAVHQIVSQWISPVSFFLTQNPRMAKILPQAMMMGAQSHRDASSAAGRHISERVPTLKDRNFVGERAIKEDARHPVLPNGFPEKAFQNVTGFLDAVNEEVLFKPMQWGDTYSANGLYFANLYKVLRDDGQVANWAEFQDALPNVTDSQVRRAKVNLEQNIAPSANNQRGALAGSKNAGITALRMLLIPFTSHRLNAVNETFVSMRDLVTGGYGMTGKERAQAAQNIAAFGVQAATFTTTKFMIGAGVYLLAKQMMNFDEEDDEKIIDLQLDLVEAKEAGDKDRELMLTAELQSMLNVRKLIRNKNQKKLSGQSLTHQIIKDIVGNTLYVAVPDESVNYVGYILDTMRSEQFKQWKEEEKQLINESIKNADSDREKARLSLMKRDVESLELLKTGHRPFGHFDSMGAFGSVVEPLTNTVSEAFDSIFDETNEFSANELLSALGIFGIGQADISALNRDLEKIQEQRQKDNIKDRDRRKRELEKEIEGSEPDSGATLSFGDNTSPSFSRKLQQKSITNTRLTKQEKNDLTSLIQEGEFEENMADFLVDGISQVNTLMEKAKKVFKEDLKKSIAVTNIPVANSIHYESPISSKIEFSGNPSSSGVNKIIESFPELKPSIDEKEISESDPFGLKAIGLEAIEVKLPNNEGELIQIAKGKKKKRNVPKASFGKVKPNSNVTHTANWIVRSSNSDKKPFIIGDKKNGKMYIFNGGGKLIADSNALFGSQIGDFISKNSSKVTPSGRFPANIDPDVNEPDKLGFVYGTTLDFFEGEKSVVSVHRLYRGLPSQNREGRIKSETSSDNRISSGCINCPDDIYDKFVRPVFEDEGGVVYVLPETEEGRRKFPAPDKIKQKLLL